MKFTVITLFPDMITGYMSKSMMWKAQKDGYIELEVVNLRDFGLGERKTVDDTPYGGGDGMLLKPEPVVVAIESVREADPNARVYLMTPQGRQFNQQLATEFSTSIEHLVLVCGRYEGFDNRIREFVDGQISIGQYVLTGGELPALSVIDAVTRLIPGVLGGESSAEIESFTGGDQLEYPQYTRPEEFRGMKVPDVLLSGNHGKIQQWRDDQTRSAS